MLFSKTMFTQPHYHEFQPTPTNLLNIYINDINFQSYTFQLNFVSD